MKHDALLAGVGNKPSPPARRRGLKLININKYIYQLGSPPARRRGLKLTGRKHGIGIRHVASRAEAWIETPSHHWARSGTGVASRAEAWIETALGMRTSVMNEVASRAEAWIETYRSH